jgi:hypothetical protein
MLTGGLVTYEIECYDGFAGVSVVFVIVALHGKILIFNNTKIIKFIVHN